MKDYNWEDIDKLLSDRTLIVENSIPSESFSLCNLLKQIEAKGTIDDNFYLMKLETAIISFCGRSKKNSNLVPYVERIERILLSDISVEEVEIIRVLLEKMQERYLDVLSKPITVKILQ